MVGESIGPLRIWLKFLKIMNQENMFCHSVGIVNRVLKFGILVLIFKLCNLNTNEIYMVVAGSTALLIVICCCIVCVYCTQEDGATDEKYMDTVWTSKGGAGEVKSYTKRRIELVA